MRLIARELADKRRQILDGQLRAYLDKRAAWPVLIIGLTEDEGAKLLMYFGSARGALAQ